MPAARAIVSPDDVHVWRIDLDSDTRPTDVLHALLCEEERARAARLVHAHHGRRFAVHRAALRAILERYLGVPPLELRFASGPHGKPCLAGAGASSNLRFSVSHSDHLALVAVARGREVGVDLERIRAGVDMLGIARRFFTPAEAEVLRSLPPADLTRAFFRCWCTMEARVKAAGLGLAGGEAVCGDATRRFSLSALDVGAGFVAMLAVEGHACRLETFRFRPPGRRRPSRKGAAPVHARRP